MANKEAAQLAAPPTEIDLINNAMEAKGISINALADQTGIAFSTLRRSLIGKRAITLTELRTIAATIGVHPSELLPQDLAA